MDKSTDRLPAVKPFLPLPFQLYDLGVFANLPSSIPLVYNAVLRCVWRGHWGHQEELKPFIEQGLMVTHTCRAKLERLTGLGRTQVWKTLKVLQHLGWLRILEVGRQTLFLVGEVASDAKGYRRESMFLDGWLLQLEAFHAETFAAEGRNEDELSLEDRIELTTTWLQQYLPSYGEVDPSSYPSVADLRGFTQTNIDGNFPHLAKRLEDHRIAHFCEERKEQNILPLETMEYLLSHTLPSTKRLRSRSVSAGLLPVFCCVCKEVVNTLQHVHSSEHESAVRVHSSEHEPAKSVHSGEHEGGSSSYIEKRKNKIDKFNRKTELDGSTILNSSEREGEVVSSITTFSGDQNEVPLAPAPKPPKPPAPRAAVEAAVEPPGVELGAELSREERIKAAASGSQRPNFPQKGGFNRGQPRPSGSSFKHNGPQKPTYTPRPPIEQRAVPLEPVVLPAYLEDLHVLWLRMASLATNLPVPNWGDRDIEKMNNLCKRFRIASEPKNLNLLKGAVVFAWHCWPTFRMQFEKYQTSTMNTGLFTSFFDKLLEASSSFGAPYLRLRTIQALVEAKEPLTATHCMGIREDALQLQALGSTLVQAQFNNVLVALREATAVAAPKMA